VDRLEGNAEGIDSPLGILPKIEDLNLDGLDLPQESLAELFNIDKNSWLEECQLTDEYFEMFGDRIPAELEAELAVLKERLSSI
jgi:phosphoenolpyruvate carboxykinase (GTP)